MKIQLLFLCFILSAGIANAECNSSQIDINTASLLELDKISYVGPATAQNIINTRPFYSLDGLLNVSGIGEAKLKAIKDQGMACVGNETNNKIGKENETLPANKIEVQDNREDKEVTENDNDSENIPKEINEKRIEENKSTENIIKLNLNENKEEKTIYESKGEKIKENLLIGFCVFLIGIIVVLIIKR
jgi:hypothetical protein